METSGRRISQILIKRVTGSSKEVLVAWGEPLPTSTRGSNDEVHTASSSHQHPVHTIHEQIKLGRRERIARFTCNSPAPNLAIGTAAFAKANRNSYKIKVSSPFLEKERKNRRRDEGGEERQAERWM